MYFCQLVLGKKFQNKAKLFNAKIKSLITLLEIFKMSISIYQSVCITFIDNRTTEQEIKRTSSAI